MAPSEGDPSPDIFVSGSPRAGTTALQIMLCQCAGTNPFIGEAEHFFGLFKLYDDVLKDFERKTAYYLTRDELTAYHTGLALDYLERIRAKFEGNPRLVLKAAWWSNYMPHMAEMIPNARFIVIVRDPLDIAASYMDAGKRGEARTGENRFPPEHLPMISHDIARQYAAIFTNRKKFGERLQAIKYESLVRQRVDLSVLGDFLSLPGLADVSEQQDSGLVDFDQVRGGHFFSELWGKELSAERIGRHKEVLSQAQIATVNNATRALREQFGYGLD